MLLLLLDALPVELVGRARLRPVLVRRRRAAPLPGGERERRRSLSGVVADGSGVVIAREKRVVVIAREKKVVATTGRKKSGRYNGEKKRWSLQRGEKKWFQLFYRRKSTHPQTNKDHKPL